MKNLAEVNNDQIIKQLKNEASSFLTSGLWSYTGYFPNDSYGKNAVRYYRWSKHVYDLIKQLESK